MFPISSVVRQLCQRTMSFTTVSPLPGPLESSIRQKLESLLQPAFINIQNDSWKHRHHAAMRDQGGDSGETHFTIQVISDTFMGKTTMERHRMVYAVLSDEFSQGLHALSLQTRTVDESKRAQA